nr:CHAT domain-containing protein [Acidobacteriota bacterium]
PSGAVADAEIDALTASFVRAIGTESILSFEPLAAGRVEGAEWLSVKDVLERFSCFDIRSARVIRRTDRAGFAEVGVDVTMMALQSSSGRPRMPPQKWVLNVVSTENGPRIAAAFTEERHFARRVAAARTASERDALLEEARAMPYEVFKEIADEVTDSILYGGWDDPAAAARAYQLAESLVTMGMASGDEALEARAWRELATLERIYGAPMAIAYAEVAREAAIRSGNCDLIAATTFTLGSTIHERGDSHRGPRLVREAAEMADSLDDPRVSLRAMHNLAVAEFSGSNFVVATELNTALSEKAVRVRYLEGEANASGNMAVMHFHLRDLDAALRYHLRAHSRYLAAGNRAFAADSLSGAALTHTAKGDVESALTLYRHASGLTDSAELRVRVAVARIDLLVDAGRLDEAECILAETDWRGFRVREDPERHRAMSRLALARGRYEESSMHASFGATSPIADTVWMSHHLAAQALRSLGRNEEARLMYDDTLAVIEEQRAAVPGVEWIRARYFGERAVVYHEQVDLLVELGRPSEALSVAERGKARALVESMQSGRVRALPRADEQVAIARLTARMTELNRELLTRRSGTAPLAAIEQELEHVRNELSRVETEVAFRVRRQDTIAEQLTLADAQSAVRADTALVAFVGGSERTTIFLVMGGGEELDVRARRVPSADVSALVERYLRAVRLRSGEERKLGQAVYELLLAPFESRIRTRQSLHIVPDGILWQVPFQALRDARGTLLIDRWDVAYAQSLTSLALSRRKQRAIDGRASFVAFGNPQIAHETAARAQSRFRNLPLIALPEAEKEVRTIARMYENATVFTGRNAREDELKRRAAGCDVLHIATHGMVDDDQPMYSALVFTPSRHEDGLLETRELLQLQIGARLTILSACDTARGAATAGEGVVSLSWALQVAGCPTTLVSLWKAESRAASALMIAFHRALLRGASTPEALRIAQQSLRRDPRFEHPFYWAPFVVIGAP